MLPPGLAFTWNAHFEYRVAVTGFRAVARFEAECPIGTFQCLRVVAQFGENDDQALLDPLAGHAPLDRMQLRFAGKGALNEL